MSKIDFKLVSNKGNFTTTRFGNVLGVNGSVIPLCNNQIEQGGRWPMVKTPFLHTTKK